MWRRGRDRGALAVQQFGADLLPLVMLFAVSITGIFLTVSTHLMRGLHFGFLSQLHAVTVIFTLLYLPFGKFFHIFQRPAQLGVAFYRENRRRGLRRRCARCGQPFASRMHIDDLKQVERELGIRYDAVAITADTDRRLDRRSYPRSSSRASSLIPSSRSTCFRSSMCIRDANGSPQRAHGPERRRADLL